MTVSEQLRQDVAAAVATALHLFGEGLERFALELTQVLGETITPDELEGWLLGKWVPSAVALLAMARIVAQPVSALFGELAIFEVTLPRLAAQVEGLRQRLREAGVIN
jgi:hypothetical protein